MCACKFWVVFLVREGSFCLVNIKLLSVSTSDSNAFREEHCVIHMMSNCSPLSDLLYQKFFALIKSLMPFMRFLVLKWLNFVSEGVAKHFKDPFVYTLHMNYWWLGVCRLLLVWIVLHKTCIHHGHALLVLFKHSVERSFCSFVF